MGKDFCRTLALYSEPDTSYYKQILSEIQYDFNKNTEKENATRNHEPDAGLAQAGDKPGRLTKPGGKSGSKTGGKLSVSGKEKALFGGNEHLKGLLNVTSKS